MARKFNPSSLARALSDALGLPRTAGLIIGALARARDSLAVDQIVRQVQSSERSVRENLQILLQRGLLIRKVFVTANKKLAYVYSLKPVDDLVEAARKEVARTLGRVEVIARRLRDLTA